MNKRYLFIGFSNIILGLIFGLYYFFAGHQTNDLIFFFGNSILGNMFLFKAYDKTN